MLVGGLLAAVDNVERKVLLSEAAVGGDSSYSDNNLYLDSKIQMPDGRLLTWEQLMTEHPEYNEFGWPEDAGIQSVAIYIPGARYHDVERREALVLLGFAAAFVVVAGVTVLRRRPR